MYAKERDQYLKNQGVLDSLLRIINCGFKRQSSTLSLGFFHVFTS